MLEVQDQAGERVLSLEPNCLDPSPTAFLWTKNLSVPEIPGERQGLFGEGSARDCVNQTFTESEQQQENPCGEGRSQGKGHA